MALVPKLVVGWVVFAKSIDIKEVVMFSDSSQEKLNSNYVMLSSLNHYSYCPRRCFLIYVEGVFVENEFTLDGKFLHNRVDSGIRSTHDGI